MSNNLSTFAPNFIVSFIKVMDWIIDLFQTTDSVAHIVLLYSIVIAVGV